MTSDPTYLVAESRDGKPSLSGRRRLVDGIDDALDTADEIDGHVFAVELIEENAVPPKPATSHVALTVLDGNAAANDFYRRVPNPTTSRPDAYPDDDDLEVA